MNKTTVKKFFEINYIKKNDIIYHDFGFVINESCRILINYSQIKQLGIKKEYIFITLEDGMNIYLPNQIIDLEAKKIIDNR